MKDVAIIRKFVEDERLGTVYIRDKRVVICSTNPNKDTKVVWLINQGNLVGRVQQDC